MMISLVARVNSCHPYLENGPSSSLISHSLRISPWLRFSTDAVVEDGGRSIGQGLLPSLNLVGVNLEPGGHLDLPLIDSNATLALKAGLCFLRALDISRSSSTAVATLSLGSGFPLN